VSTGASRASCRASELERYCEIIAALKLRTSNKKGRHLSTNRAIELLEGEGVETSDGLVRVPPDMLTRTTVNRYLRDWGYDHARMIRAPAAVRFQARRSNELWQFDLSPSDLKEVEKPLGFQPGRGNPTLMLYSVVDDRSGVAYQEYRCVYGEDVEASLRFLFNAMAPKPDESKVSPWLAALLKRKSPKLAAVALANKTARIAWKMMVTGEANSKSAVAA
jgi:hypothetical protein